MQRNNTYDIAKCWAIVSVIVYHVINIIFYNQIIHSFIDTYFLALFWHSCKYPWLIFVV